MTMFRELLNAYNKHFGTNCKFLELNEKNELELAYIDSFQVKENGFDSFTEIYLMYNVETQHMNTYVMAEGKLRLVHSVSVTIDHLVWRMERKSINFGGMAISNVWGWMDLL